MLSCVSVFKIRRQDTHEVLTVACGTQPEDNIVSKETDVLLFLSDNQGVYQGHTVVYTGERNVHL